MSETSNVTGAAVVRSSTLTKMMAEVNSELDNKSQGGTASATGDGSTTVWVIAPPYRAIIDDNAFAVYIDDTLKTETTHYTMNFITGECTFVSAPALDAVIEWQFNYVYWTDAQVQQAVMAGIDSLFPEAYAEEWEVVTCSDDTFEYTLTTEGIEFITRVERKGTYDEKWTLVKRGRYDVYYDAYPTIKFFTAPTTGSLRVRLIKRPALTAVGPAEVLNVGDRFKAPIISYACYHLLTQKLGPRTRIDTSVATTGTGVLYPSQMAQSGQAFYMRYQIELASLRMKPWSTR